MIWGMDAWIVWLILAAVLIAIEALTVNLLTIWFAVGALAALVTDLLGGSVLLQCIIAIAVSCVVLVVVLVFRPFDRLKNSETIPTNFDRVIGHSGYVVNRIDGEFGRGVVSVMGQDWTAVSRDGQAFEEGESVVICAVSGVKLVVAPNNEKRGKE